MSINRVRDPSADYTSSRAKNLCFYCDKKYLSGHKCEGQMFTLEIKGMDEGELEGCLEEGEAVADLAIKPRWFPTLLSKKIDW